MRSTTRTCLALCTCCVIALRALAMKDGQEETKEKTADDFDFEFEGFANDEPELASLEVEEAAAPVRKLEPEAEMLPANYEGVRWPGVDHMEMTRVVEEEEEEEEEKEMEPSDAWSRTRRLRRRFEH